MHKISLFVIVLIISLVISNVTHAKDFSLLSTDIKEGEKLSGKHVYKGFGCEGQNLSPQLSWVNPPEGTKSYAITMYDPDAPTGSGWWHWNIINISAKTVSLAQGASSNKKLAPEGSVELVNDYGKVGFGGACPPKGEVHRYIVTIYALAIDKIDIPANASNALAGFMIKSNTLAQDSITAIYVR